MRWHNDPIAHSPRSVFVGVDDAAYDVAYVGAGGGAGIGAGGGYACPPTGVEDAGSSLTVATLKFDNARGNCSLNI